jgi:N-acetylglucosamine-6-sulfatase
VWLSQVAPHQECSPKRVAFRGSCWGPPSPAPRHVGTYAGLEPRAFSDPAFDEKDVSDKPAYIRDRAPLDASDEKRLRRLAQARAESLLSLDESVAKTVTTLRKTGELRNTVILYTSDNGYLLGQHRFEGKTVGYEQSLRVPLLVRGPGVPSGVDRGRQVSLVDVPAGIADLANARRHAGHSLDGQSFVPTARNGRAMKHDSLLIQAGATKRGTGGWKWRGIRTRRYTLMAHRAGDEVELYDRLEDPHQLRSVHDVPRYAETRTVLERHLSQREKCSGSSCVRNLGAVPGPS